MSKAAILPATLVLVTVGAVLAFAYSSEPPEELTGAPGEADCTDCHNSFALNQDGTLAILDGPALYRTGATYRMRVSLTTSNTAGIIDREWGFELTAINANTGAGVGTFANVAGQNTTIVAGSGAHATRRYVMQTNSRPGAASPVEWLVDWTAPSPGNVPVVFYASGVAGNGGQGTGGDWVYTTSVAAADTTTDARATTWGELKARYRR